MSLEDFFNPRSVAIVGASAKQGKVGYEILTSMQKGGYPGKIFPVNNKAEQILGLKCYPDLPSIGEVPDLVLIIVPAQVVADVMRQCVSIKAKNVIIITAG
ncbi:MAG: CoA-binding protein, partial [Phycisphaerae bacterium]